MDVRDAKLAQYEVSSDRGRAAYCNRDAARSGAGGAGREPARPETPNPSRRGLAAGNRMPTITSLARFTVPLGRQDTELQEVVHDAGGMRLLRVRIREKSRFTIFDVDPVTARLWGEAMRQ